MRRMITILAFFCTSHLFPQDLSYTQYSTKDGLPGSTVYQSLQDHNGFIWFATNQGVSRFDGKTFTNFSKEDGLPDNDILKLYLDKYNNVWFISLMGIPSVYYEGRIHRLDSCRAVYAIVEDFLSDSLFLMAHVSKSGVNYFGYYRSANTPGHWHFSNPVRAGVDPFQRCPLPQASSEKKISFYFSAIDPFKAKILVKKKGFLAEYPFPRGDDNYPFQDVGPPVELTPDKGSILLFANGIYRADGDGVRCILPAELLHLKFTEMNAIFCENDSVLWLCTRNRGLIRVKNYLRPDRSFQYFFTQAFCTSIFKDREDGYWVTTHSDGVYYLPSPEVYYLPGEGGDMAKNVRCIAPIGAHTLAAGFANGKILVMDGATLKYNFLSNWDRQNKNSRILGIRKLGHRIMVTSDRGLDWLFPDKDSNLPFFPYSAIKGFFWISDSTIFLGSNNGLFTWKISERESARYLFTSRVTCVEGIGAHCYWGTLNGIYVFSDSVHYLGKEYPELSGPIHHIDIGPDSAIWVSTQQGLAVLRNGVLSMIRCEQGLPGNSCKQAFIDGNTAWISTDKGISRMRYHWAGDRLVYTLSNITESDGLISNDVNQTAVCGDYLWAATGRGICYFPKNYSPVTIQKPLININTVESGDKGTIRGDTVAIDYRKNKLLIDLSGISFRSGNSIRYQYRLRELDNNWTVTPNHLLEFSTLPFGVYTFEARAIDRWGVVSNGTKQVVISVRPPFWKTSWFTLFTYFCTALLIGGCTWFYSRRQNRKKEKEYRLKKKMDDLEMMALRARMNPHFIFNCLSSIQHYILRADVANANLYLYKFSTLIRNMLQHSSNSDITLAEELKMLCLYLELEKLRMGDRMNYTLVVDEGLLPEQLFLPSMMIQPHVENAIKHGLSPLREGSGMLRIEFSVDGGYLAVIIDDNGIGIGSAMQGEKMQLPGYRSMGTSITQSRVNMINATQRDKMELEITDKREKGSNEQGTLVRLRFPIKNNPE
jgi:hypothetical protein